MRQNKFLKHFYARRSGKPSRSTKPAATTPEHSPTPPPQPAKVDDAPAKQQFRDGFKDESTGIYHPSPAKTKQFLQHSKDCHRCADEAKQLGLA